LQPAVKPIERRLLPREAEESRKESVRVAVASILSKQFLLNSNREHASNRVVSSLIKAHSKISISVEACHGVFGEVVERPFHDYILHVN
jgi:hypothetical protein